MMKMRRTRTRLPRTPPTTAVVGSEVPPPSWPAVVLATAEAPAPSAGTFGGGVVSSPLDFWGSIAASGLDEVVPPAAPGNAPVPTLALMVASGASAAVAVGVVNARSSVPGVAGVAGVAVVVVDVLVVVVVPATDVAAAVAAGVDVLLVVLSVVVVTVVVVLVAVVVVVVVAVVTVSVLIVVVVVVVVVFGAFVVNCPRNTHFVPAPSSAE